MRRLVVLIVGGLLLLSSPAALAGSAVAADEPAQIVLRKSRPPAGYAPVIQFDVEAAADRGITKIEVTLQRYVSRELVGKLEDFELINGSINDGTWRSRSSLPVVRQNYWVVTRIVDLDGNERSFEGYLAYGLKPEFVDVSMTPTTIDIENQWITYQGRLIVRAEDGSERPAAGVRVRGTCSVGGVGGRIPVTDAEGRFSGRVPNSAGVDTTCWVTSPTNENYVQSQSPVTKISWVNLHTRISGDVPSDEVKAVGSTTVMTGLLERRSRAGDWAGLPGATVDITFKDDETGTDTPVGKAVTEADGTYRAVVPVTGSGMVRAAYGDLAVGGRNGYTFSSVTDRLQAGHRIEVTGFKATPNPVGKGASLTVAGRLTRPAATGSRAVVINGYLDVEFSPDGRQWSQRAYGRSDGQGYFKVPVAAVSDGHWRVRYLGTSPGDNSLEHTPDLETVSGSAQVDVRYRTAVSFDAAPEPVVKGRTLTVSGVLKRAVNGSTWKVWGGKTVSIYYQVPGSTAWTYAGTVKTTSSGKFVKGFKASKDATWKAVYTGDADNLRADSATDYVDVR